VKLRFERFEGLSCFSIRGPISESSHKILEVGLETLCKTLAETLVVNLTLATFDANTTKYLIDVKKKIATLTKFKIHWITSQKGLSDFIAINVFTSRLTGFKSRQIGERIQLEDEVYTLQSRTLEVEKRILELGGDHDRAQAIILENRTLKAQEKVLKAAVRFQEERMKLQTKIPSLDLEVIEKTKIALDEFNQANPEKVIL
jgi:hypothetical protein